MARASLRCRACGLEVAADDPAPFRCKGRRQGDDIDHLLTVVWDEPPSAVGDESDPNPFVAFRGRSYSHFVALERGLSDGQYVQLVRELDAAVGEVDGRGFRVTPWRHDETLGAWFKDESGNVAGSHKARHLFGLALWIEVAERTGLLEPGVLGGDQRPLAIASCGNAALAAAVVARGWGRRLRVFIPTWAEVAVVARLRELGASITTCERAPGGPAGDPCFHAFREAVDGGAVPFTCQGSENGLVIDGGQTLGFELARDVARGRPERLEHLFVQVGGGALASATWQALELALPAGTPRPAIHAVQTVGCQPLVQAWRRLALDLRAALASGDAGELDDVALAHWLAENANPETSRTVFARALRQRSRYMRAVDAAPESIASGILDDETYDWFVVVRAMIESGGWPLVVSEADLVEARDAARAASGSATCATGAAGLAGLEVARRAGWIPRTSTCGVLFTGVQR